VHVLAGRHVALVKIAEYVLTARRGKQPADERLD
jgi:hypothetical protein